MQKMPAKHHYVPEFLIRNFGTPDSCVFFYDKESPKKGIQERNPGNILFQKHIYTRIDPKGLKDVEQELAYGKLEHAVAPVIRKIIEKVRRGCTANLSPEQKQLWDAFIYEQWRRVPDLHAALFTPALFEKIKSNTVANLERIRPLRPDERDLISDPTFTSRLFQNAKVNVLADRSASVMQILGSRALAVARLTKPNKSFILGSRPVVKITPNGHKHLSHPEVEFWLPIAPDILAGMGRHGASEILLYPHDGFVRGFNTTVFLQSTRVVARSRDLLESLLKRR